MPFLAPDNTYLYSVIEQLRSNFSPIRFNILLLQQLLNQSNNIQLNQVTGTQFIKSAIDISERLSREYTKPEFGITECTINDKIEKIVQKTIVKDPFCHLLHFSKPHYKKKQPKLLILAPMSGHYATLLRDTVESSLHFADVYITDWINVNQVPITEGSFDLDSFIDYLIKYMELLGPNLHVFAVCQPTVPALAATAIMHAEKKSNIPSSLILAGGPVDPRINPTVPGQFALDKDLEYFDKSMITKVPKNYPGYRRRVYPGFLQLLGFLSMNLNNHLKSHMDLFKNLMVEDDIKVEKQKKFYDEYFSVMDLPAEFYLQTIKEVFHDFSLAKGTWKSRGRKIDLSLIKSSALMGIEGGKDDIAAVGQTKAALKLCSSIPENKKQYHLQKDAGHYGIFSGSKFRNSVVPAIKNFIYKIDKTIK